jgi:hypothetical protein
MLIFSILWKDCSSWHPNRRLDFRKVVKFASRDNWHHYASGIHRSWGPGAGARHCTRLRLLLLETTHHTSSYGWRIRHLTHLKGLFFGETGETKWNREIFVTCHESQQVIQDIIWKSWPGLSKSVIYSKEFPWSHFSILHGSAISISNAHFVRTFSTLALLSACCGSPLSLVGSVVIGSLVHGALRSSSGEQNHPLFLDSNMVVISPSLNTPQDVARYTSSKLQLIRRGGRSSMTIDFGLLQSIERHWLMEESVVKLQRTSLPLMMLVSGKNDTQALTCSVSFILHSSVFRDFGWV